MQAYFEPEQAFSISMLQPVFEISIAYKKNMYAIPTIIFVHYKHHRWKTIKVSHYHSAQPNFPVYCTLRVYYFGRNLAASRFILPSTSIWNWKECIHTYLTRIWLYKHNQG